MFILFLGDKKLLVSLIFFTFATWLYGMENRENQLVDREWPNKAVVAKNLIANVKTKLDDAGKVENQTIIIAPKKNIVPFKASHTQLEDLRNKLEYNKSQYIKAPLNQITNNATLTQPFDDIAVWGRDDVIGAALDADQRGISIHYYPYFKDHGNTNLATGKRTDFLKHTLPVQGRISINYDQSLNGLRLDIINDRILVRFPIWHEPTDLWKKREQINGCDCYGPIQDGELWKEPRWAPYIVFLNKVLHQTTQQLRGFEPTVINFSKYGNYIENIIAKEADCIFISTNENLLQYKLSTNSAITIQFSPVFGQTFASAAFPSLSRYLKIYRAGNTELFWVNYLAYIEEKNRHNLYDEVKEDNCFWAGLYNNGIDGKGSLSPIQNFQKDMHIHEFIGSYISENSLLLTFLFTIVRNNKYYLGVGEKLNNFTPVNYYLIEMMKEWSIKNVRGEKNKFTFQFHDGCIGWLERDAAERKGITWNFSRIGLPNRYQNMELISLEAPFNSIVGQDNDI